MAKSRARWIRGPITLATTTGPITAWGEVYGQWAVHQQPPQFGPILGWTITHAPTGYAARKGIRTKAEAKRLVRLVHWVVGDTPITSGGLPTDLRDQLGPLLYPDHVDPVAAGGRAHGGTDG